MKKSKRYLFALKMKDGSTKRFFVTTDDPFEKTRHFMRQYKNTVEDVVFRPMK